MKHLYVLSTGALFLSFPCLGQSIATVTPSSAEVGQGLSVSIVCANDQLVSCSQIGSFPICNSTVSRVYFKSGDSLRIASAISNVQTTSLVADIAFPLTCPTGAWDVAVEHVGGSTIWKTGGFTLNALSPPVLTSVSPSTVFQNRKTMITINGDHTHFKIARDNAIVNNVTAVRLTREASWIQAESTSIQSSTKIMAFFTLKDSSDTGYFDVHVDQGGGLPSAELAKALYIKCMPPPSYSLPAGCIAYYPFEGDAVDYSDNGNDGTIHGASWVDGMYGTGLNFNGKDDYISVPNSPNLAITDGLSICAWVKPEKGNLWYRIVGKANAGNSDNDWLIGEAMAGGIYFSIWKGVGQFYTDGKTPLVLNEWNHIAGTWDGKCMRIYLNGVLQPESVSVSPPINSSSNPLNIGKMPENDYFFKGVMDEIMIFNRGLSGAEVDSILKGTHLWKSRNDSAVPEIVSYKPKVTVDPRPVVAWHPVAKATTYTLTIATDPGFSSIITTMPLSDTAFAPSANLPVGPIYWHVKSDLSTRWSTTDKFIIQSDTIPYLHRYNGGEVQSLKPKFIWNKVANAAAYRIEVAKNSSFTSPVIAMPLSDTAAIPSVNLDTGMFYWHVSCDRNISLFCTADSLVIRKPSVRSNKQSSALPAAYSFVLRGRPQSASFIQFSVPKASAVTLRLFDIHGKLLKELSRFCHEPGFFQSPLDLSGFPSGFYMVDFKAGAFSATKRITNLY
jgi:hypothetical protein